MKTKFFTKRVAILAPVGTLAAGLFPKTSILQGRTVNESSVENAEQALQERAISAIRIVRVIQAWLNNQEAVDLVSQSAYLRPRDEIRSYILPVHIQVTPQGLSTSAANSYNAGRAGH